MLLIFLIVRTMRTIFACMNNKAKTTPGCNTDSGKAALAIINNAVYHLGMSFTTVVKAGIILYTF